MRESISDMSAEEVQTLNIKLSLSCIREQLIGQSRSLLGRLLGKFEHRESWAVGRQGCLSAAYAEQDAGKRLLKS